MGEADQLYVFFSCVLSGVVAGVAYDILYLVKKWARNRAVRIALDVFFFVLFSGIYVFVSVMFSLPSFRLYMFLGCLVGLLLYLKSMHRILDFFVKRLYNIKKKK
ncbi:MAG: hypothetical protein IJY26_00655 [Clostridia bacterium]|nr:hypothetical protein [Clostridia bacterium]